MDQAYFKIEEEEEEEQDEISSLELTKSVSIRSQINQNNPTYFQQQPAAAALLPPLEKQSSTGQAKKLVLQLSKMGFQKSKIESVLKRVGVIDVTEAVQYLSVDQKGKFIHQFKNEFGVCSYCGFDESEHALQDQDVQKEVLLQVQEDPSNPIPLDLKQI